MTGAAGRDGIERVVFRAGTSSAFGVVVGVIALCTEAFVGNAPLRLEALAVYALIGGALGGVSRGLFGLFFPRSTAGPATLAVLSAFLGLGLAHFANIHLLPGEHYLAWKSLTLDGLIGAVILAGLVIFRGRVEQVALRQRWERRARFSALVIVLLCLVALGRTEAERGAVQHQSGERPDLALIIVDSVRPDRLGMYGYAEATSPAVDALAASGRVFKHALSYSSWTVPTVQRLLSTGLLQDPDLATMLSRHGYSTGAFTDNPHLDERSPLVRAFDTVERSVGSGRRFLSHTVIGDILDRVDPGDDRRLVDKALAWLGKAQPPVFLYIHLMDAHTPYRFSRLDGRRRASGRRIEFPFPGMEITADEAEDIRARYDTGVRRTTDEAARILAALAKRGRPFVAVLTSDHGESLGESGRWHHSSGLVPELLAVPLVLWGEGVQPGEVDARVGTASITGTLLTAAGLACDTCGGSDLRRSAGEAVVEGALPPSQAYRVAGGYKVIVDISDGERRLYDLRNDALESTDLALRRPRLTAELARQLAPAPTVRVPMEQTERLRALGYVHLEEDWLAQGYNQADSLCDAAPPQPNSMQERGHQE